MRFVKRGWFYFISLITGWLPDIKLVMRMRGFLLRPSFKACGRNFQVARRVTINSPLPGNRARRLHCDGELAARMGRNHD